MKPCGQCINCGIYRDYWCNACKKKWSCNIRKNMTKQHRIEKGCEFECGDLGWCTAKENLRR